MAHSHPDDLSLEECREALLAAARVVSRYPEYLPLYERVEREFLDRQQGATVLERAMRLASASQNAPQSVQHALSAPTLDR